MARTETGTEARLQPVQQLVRNIKYAGQLGKFYEKWKTITEDSYVLNAIRGFKIPFISQPYQFIEPKCPEMSKSECEAISSSLLPLIESGAIVKSKEEVDQFISNIFTVKKSNGTNRLVINLKPLNEFVDCPHFKMEDHRTVCNLMSRDCYMASIDLKDAYHLIPIAKMDQKYFKFRWAGQLYKYTCIPFGLNIAPRLWTKVLKPVVGYLRKQGYISVYFLDDTLLIGTTLQECQDNVDVTVSLFKQLGLRINEEKSVLVPTTRVKFLGFEFCSKSMSVILPQLKKFRIVSLINDILKLEQFKIECLARIIGTLVAAVPAVKYGQVYVRAMEVSKTKALRCGNGDYRTLMRLDSESITDLKWWLNNISASSKAINTDSFDLVLFTDASLTGWGGSCGSRKAKGYWNEEERLKHINVLELLAIWNCLRAFVRNDFVNILLRVDNTTAISYINRYGGCRSSNCQQVAKQIWIWCEERNINLQASYINTVDNFIADKLSRDDHKDIDFQLSPEAFKIITTQLLNPKVDHFATYRSRQCKKYVSWFPDIDCIAVDAFTIRWDNDFYAFPPFSMIGRVLKKIFNEKARGIVVVPNWPTQSLYPLFMKLADSHIIYFPKGSDCIISPYENRIHEISSYIPLMAATLSSKPLPK